MIPRDRSRATATGATGDVVAVTLDAAGTLFTLREPLGRVYARFARRARSHDPRHPPQPGEIEQAFQRQFSRMPALAFPPLPGPELRRRERAWWRELVRRVAAEVDGLPGPDDAGGPDGWFDELYDHYAGGAAWRTFEEVPAVVRRLREAGLRLAALTNFDSRVESILDELGLATFLDAVITSSRAGAAKPEPAIFRAALRRLESPAPNTLHVGDRADLDLEGARSAGLQALVVRRSLGHPPWPPPPPSQVAPRSEKPVIADLRGVLDHLGLAPD